VYLDGEKIFDRKQEEGSAMPNLIRLRQLKKVVQEKLDSIPAAAD